MEDHLKLGLPQDLSRQEEGGQVDADLLEHGVLDDVLEPGEVHGSEEVTGGRPDLVNDLPRGSHELDLLFDVAGGGLPIPDDREREGPGRDG